MIDDIVTYNFRRCVVITDVELIGITYGCILVPSLFVEVIGGFLNDFR